MPYLSAMILFPILLGKQTKLRVNDRNDLCCGIGITPSPLGWPFEQQSSLAIIKQNVLHVMSSNQRVPWIFETVSRTAGVAATRTNCEDADPSNKQQPHNNHYNYC